MISNIEQPSYWITDQAGAASRRAGEALIILAMTFNAVFCFISTVANIHISSADVVACELCILTAGIYLIRNEISRQAIQVTFILIVFLVGMKLVNVRLDLKLIHDIAIMYIFYKIGTCSNIWSANRLVWGITLLVLGFGAFEIMFPDQFSEYFNVWSYYVDKGGIPATTINYGNTTNFISGIRAGEESRTFFPSLLGPGRFSSIFLEPVSMGNFSVLCFGWCISTNFGKPRMRALLIFLAALCAILPDSRFAFACWLPMLFLRVTSLYRFRIIVFFLPILTMLALVITGALHQMPGVTPAIQQDNFPGRLLFSGRLLNYWGVTQWLGLAPSPVYTTDTGYAYAINNLGLPIALLLWALFAAHTPRTQQAMSMKAMVAVYAATSLCIGANMFTIKTASLCWFLYGAANVVMPPGRLPSLRLWPQPLREAQPTAIAIQAAQDKITS